MDENILFEILDHNDHQVDNIILFKTKYYRDKVKEKISRQTAQRLKKLIFTSFSHCYFWEYLYFPPDKIQIESIFNTIGGAESPGFYNRDDLIAIIKSFDDYLTGFKIKKRKHFLFEKYPNVNANIIF